MRLGRLHVIIDVSPDAPHPVELADAALAGGAPVLQVRPKGVTDAVAYEAVAAIAERCRAAGAACIVNDRADLALATGADGVHVGAEDLPVDVARRLVGPGALVGGTARRPETSEQRQAAGASYLGIGPIYLTSSKEGLPPPLGPAMLTHVAAAVTIPLIAISGITVPRVGEVIAAGAYGVAVIGAIARAPDPQAATAAFVAALTRAAGGVHA